VTFPATALPAVTELLVNGAWVDVTPDVRASSGLAITRGRRDEMARVSTATCSLVLDNRSGTYSNRLPTSPYYGLLGRNTQLRHRLRWVRDTFTRNESGSWGTSDTSQAWTSTGGSASDYSVNGSKGFHTLTSVNVLRNSLVALPAGTPDAVAVVNVSATATGASLTGRVIVGTSTINYYGARLDFTTAGDVTLAINKNIGGVGASVVAAVTVGTYVTGTQWSVRIQRHSGYLRAKSWLAVDPEPSAWTLASSTPETEITGFTVAGLLSRAETGNTNVNPIVAYDSFSVNDYRFWGEVPSWPQAWDTSGSDVTAPIEAAGIMRRLGAGAKPLRSAMYRSMAGVSEGDFQPVAYWSMEDGSDATQAASALGHPAANVSGAVAFASYGGIVGSDSLPVINDGGAVDAGIPGFTDTGVWQLQFVANIPSQPASTVTFLDVVTTPGSGSSIARVRFYYDSVSGFPRLQVLDAAGAEIAGNGFTSMTYGQPFLYAITQYLSGGTFVTNLAQFAANGSSQQAVAVTAGNPGRPTAWRASATSVNAGWALGHVALYTDPAVITSPSIGPNAAGMAAYAGETAADRMIRLCREEGIGFTLIGNASDTQLVGPQQSAALLTNLQACADVDQGILGEPRDALGLLYRTNRSMLNQAGPALDYAAKRLAPPLRPTDDDQQVRNRVTASRIAGSSATAELTSGSLSTQDSPDGIGLYDEQVTVNSYTDGQLPYIAGWRVRLGTWDEARFPQVSVNFGRLLMDGQTALAGQVAGVDAGDYLSITNPPAWLPPDQIELLAQGYRETHRGFEWLITYNAVPAGPYNAFVIGDQTDGRLDTSGCIVNEAVTSSATSLKLCIWNGPPSITSAARSGDFPFDLALRPAPLDANTGERARVTAMGSVTAPTFVAAGTASSGSSGSRTPGMPAGVASGDVVLIFASTRNSGTGTVDTPADWTQLLDFGNMALLGRIYDGAWTMPTVTFTGGAANEDTLAQSCAFRNMCFDLSRIAHSSNTQLNASAQDIATPLLGVRRDRCVVLHLGWKQDDYTSVAALSGSIEIQELSSVAGNDASQIWDYRIQTTATGIDETSFVVTGGASAISRSAVIALVGGYQTATVTRSINGVSMAQPAGTPASLWRPARPAL